MREEGASSNKLSGGDPQLSLFCGVTLRQAKNPNTIRPESFSSGKSGLQSDISNGSKGNENLTVQLMNEVNEAVSSDMDASSTHIIPEPVQSKDNSDFVMPESNLVPYIVVVSLVGDSSPYGHASPSKKKGPLSSSSSMKQSLSKEGSAHSSIFTNSTDDWLLHPWEDPDCQIVGYTPPTKGVMKLNETPTVVKDLSNKSSIPNGPGNMCDIVDSIAEPPSPLDFSTFSNLEPVPSTKPYYFVNNGESNTNNNAEKFTSKPPKKEISKVQGNVIQCVKFPTQFQKEHIEVQSILPSINKQHVIVVLSTRMEFSRGSPDSSEIETSFSNHMIPNDNFLGGGVLVYPVKSENNRVILDTEPAAVLPITSPKDVITSTFLLPMEVEDLVSKYKNYFRQIFKHFL